MPRKTEPATRKLRIGTPVAKRKPAKWGMGASRVKSPAITRPTPERASRIADAQRATGRTLFTALLVANTPNTPAISRIPLSTKAPFMNGPVGPRPSPLMGAVIGEAGMTGEPVKIRPGLRKPRTNQARENRMGPTTAPRASQRLASRVAEAA
jgi:hypothetical protein